MSLSPEELIVYPHEEEVRNINFEFIFSEKDSLTIRAEVYYLPEPHSKPKTKKEGYIKYLYPHSSEQSSKLVLVKNRERHPVGGRLYSRINYGGSYEYQVHQILNLIIGESKDFYQDTHMLSSFQDTGYYKVLSYIRRCRLHLMTFKDFNQALEEVSL